jgi:eukaryotic-like serine/threonine-protein kinase
MHVRTTTEKRMIDGFIWCPYCGKPHRLEDRFCSATGKPLDRRVHRPSSGDLQKSLINETIGDRYRIIRLIGSGGMGDVYEAENLTLGRQVAIKVVSAQRAKVSADAISRLQREAHAVARIHHPNVCDIYDIGTLPDGSPYLVLERLIGETLEQRHRRRRSMMPQLVVDLYTQVLSGLHVLHGMGIVHRDLKPGNIFLVDRPGCGPLVKLLDFGFAKDVSAATWRRITQPGRACGTPQYMSPEQLRCEPMDFRSDLFSVGLMLFETLTGQHPFAAKTALDTGSRILTEQAPLVSTVKPRLLKAFDQVVACALSKKPDGRYQTAEEMQSALQNVLPREEDEPTSTSNEIPIPTIGNSSTPV